MLSLLKTKGIAGQDFQLTCSNVWMLLAVWSIESCALIFRSERQISSDISHSHYSLPPIGSVTVFGVTSFFDSKFDFFLSGLAYLKEEVDIAEVEGDVEESENEKVVQPFRFWRPHSTVPPASNAEKEKSI